MTRVWTSVAGAMLLATIASFGMGTTSLAQSGATGQLKVDAEPGRAGVFVDGKYIGPAANFGRTRTYTLPVGTHEVLLREPRYKDATLKVTIEADKTATLKQDLEAVPELTPPWAKLKTKAPGKYTGVFVNGAFMGHTDEFDNFAQGLLLKPGDYQVKLTLADGSKSHEQKVTLEADKTVTVEWDGR